MNGRVDAQVRSWRHATFGPASETPYRRRTSDWIQLVVGVAFLMWAVPRSDDVSAASTALFEFLDQLPAGPQDLMRLLYGLGTLWAAGLVLVAALLARRWRLARDLALAAALAWLVARGIAELRGGATAAEAVQETMKLGSGSPAYPAVRLAVITAVARTAAPYLTRTSRAIGLVLVLLTAVGTMYLGVGLPNAVVAALVLGWVVAAAVHLAFGSPGGRPTRAQMVETLRELGVDAGPLEFGPTRPHRATTMVGSDESGPLHVRVLGRDEADAQWLRRAWHLVAYKSVPGRLFTTRIEDVEQQGYAVLRAAQAGVRVPEVVVTGTAGPGVAVYVERPLWGPSLDELPPDEVTEGLLEDLWRQVARLHDANVAHLDLTAENVVLADDGIGIGGFDHAVASDRRGFRAHDVASLLVSTAGLVGVDRAVAAAAFGLGRDRLAAALPLVQTAVLPSSLRPERTDRAAFRDRLAAVRAAAAHACDVEAPELTELHRISPTNLFLVAGTFLGVAALLSQVGDPADLWDTMSQADWAWVAAALVVSFSTNVATAIALMGSVPIRIPLGRTTELELSLVFANLAVPTVGGLASQVRYLQKQGTDLASAVAAGGVISGVANVVVSVALCLLAFVLAPIQLDTSSVSTSTLLSVLLIAAVVVGVGCALVFGVPTLRHKVVEPSRSAWSTIVAVARSPRQVFQLTVGWAGNVLLYALVLWCCVAAFGPPVNFWTALLVNTGVSTLAFMVPVPGGATAVSSVGTAGVLTAVGVSQDVAVAASLAYQVTATFIPAVPGWVAFKDLMDRDYL